MEMRFGRLNLLLRFVKCVGNKFKEKENMKISSEKLAAIVEQLGKFTATVASAEEPYRAVQFKVIDSETISMSAMNFYEMVEFGKVPVTEATNLPAKFFIDTATLKGIVKASSKPETELTIDEVTKRVKLENGALYHIDFFDSPTDWPAAPASDTQWQTVTVGGLKTTLPNLMRFVSKDASIPHLTGVQFGPNKDGVGLAYSFNGFQGVKYEGVPKELEACFPAQVLSVFAGMGAEDKLDVCKVGNHIFFRQGSVISGAVTYGDQFPVAQIDEVLKKEQQWKAVFSVIQLKQAASRSKLFGAGKGNEVAELSYIDNERVMYTVIDEKTKQRFEQVLDLRAGSDVPDTLFAHVSLDFLDNMTQVFTDKTELAIAYLDNMFLIEEDGCTCWASAQVNQAYSEEQSEEEGGM